MPYVTRRKSRQITLTFIRTKLLTLWYKYLKHFLKNIFGKLPTSSFWGSKREVYPKTKPGWHTTLQEDQTWRMHTVANLEGGKDCSGVVFYWCVKVDATEGAICRWGMPSRELPKTALLQLQVNEGAECGMFGALKPEDISQSHQGCYPHGRPGAGLVGIDCCQQGHK